MTYTKLRLGADLATSLDLRLSDSEFGPVLAVLLTDFLGCQLTQIKSSCQPVVPLLLYLLYLLEI